VASVELHHQLFYPYYHYMPPAEVLFERSVEMKVNGVSCRALSPEDLLLHVALHASIYGKRRIRIRQLVDIDRIVEARKIDWDRVMARLAQPSMSKCVYTVLYLAKHLIGTRGIPPDVLTSLRVKSGSLDRWLAGPCRHAIFRGRSSGNRSGIHGYRLFRRVARYVEQVLWPQTWSDRLRIVINKIRVSVTWRLTVGHKRFTADTEESLMGWHRTDGEVSP
jgi:hypothetical protein